MTALQIEQPGRVPYEHAHRRQMELLRKLHEERRADDVCLILEHDPVFTLGRHARPEHVCVSENFLAERKVELVRVERGGEVTYHGPGQLVCYPMVNLRRAGFSVVDFVSTLEQIMLNVVQRFGIAANRDSRNHGIWCGDRKIGSVGIVVRHGISYHGLALNVNSDLEPFEWINPCGLTGVSVSSMEHECGRELIFDEVQEQMKEKIQMAFARPAPKRKRLSRPERLAKPAWLRQHLPTGPGYEQTRRLLSSSGLHTVCQEARCPNQFECYGKGAATFILMGESCTRNCRFCNVKHGITKPLDPDEPIRTAAAVAEMGLSYVVLTSVSRDDLSDGGAEHFGRTIAAIRRHCPGCLVEVLIPDFQGSMAALKQLCHSKPAVINHNVETVAVLYPEVRPQAIYERSLELLKRVREIDPGIITKSGLMLGLGETREDLLRTMADIRETGCDLLTLGQYLQPSVKHLPVKRYVPPEEFDCLGSKARDLGFAGVAAGPHVRSSYRAGELYRSVQKRDNKQRGNG